MIIGEKDKFAIEYDITDKYCREGHRYLFGKTQIYIQDYKLGFWNDENLIGVLAAQLKNIVRLPKRSIPDLESFSEANLKKLFEERDSYSASGLFQVLHVENFDDYYISVYKQNQSLFFIWRFIDQPTQKHENLDREVHVCEIDEFYFNQIVQEFDLAFHKELDLIPPC